MQFLSSLAFNPVNGYVYQEAGRKRRTLFGVFLMKGEKEKGQSFFYYFWVDVRESIT